MDLELVRVPITTYREVFCGNSEQPIDLDISLPDYCPDIARILKCQVAPQITARTIVGDRLTVEGSAIIRVFYADEERGALRCCELSSAFSADFNLRTAPELPSVFTETRVDFMNCRAVTKRRVDIHCAFTITAHVYGTQRQEVLTAAHGGGVRVRSAEVPACEHVGAVQQPITVDEEFTLESGRTPPETILRFCADGRITDVRTVANRVMVKGEFCIHVLYSTDAVTGQTDTVEYTVPFSQILDMEGLDDRCRCDARLELLSMQVQLNEADGGQVAFEAELRGAVCVIAMKPRTVCVLLDAYSTDYETTLERADIQFTEADAPLKRTLIARGTLPDGAAGTRVLDAWSEPRGVTASCKDGKLELSGRICAALLLCGDDGKASYQETLLDLADSSDWAKANAEFNPRLHIDRMSYRVNGAGRMEVQAETTVECSALTTSRHNVVAQITADTEHPKEKDPQCAMTLYYAEKGEAVWEIARRYNTTQEAIQTENNLSADQIEEDGMLFIPAV